MTELEAIRRYWNTRAEGYSLKTAYDLQHAEKSGWNVCVRLYLRPAD